MQTPALALARRFELSARRFEQLALLNVTMLVVIVATGATVRLTDSGLGCESWPGCQDRYRLPAQGFHSYVEFGNRLVAFVTILVTLALGVGSTLVPALSRRVKTLAWLTFAGTFGQAPLGALTVHFHLNPWLVLSHFLLSLVVLTAGVVVANEAIGRRRGWAPPLVPAWARRAALVLGLACAAMVVTGTLVTAAGPHPGGVAVRRLGSFQPALEVHVRATAVFGIALLGLLAYLWPRRAAAGGLLRVLLALLAVVLVQMAVGEAQYRLELPWWLVLVHVTVAAVVWAAATAVVISFFRPVGALARPGA